MPISQKKSKIEVGDIITSGDTIDDSFWFSGLVLEVRENNPDLDKRGIYNQGAFHVKVFVLKRERFPKQEGTVAYWTFSVVNDLFVIKGGR